jgi:hypothetical protein
MYAILCLTVSDFVPGHSDVHTAYSFRVEDQAKQVASTKQPASMTRFSLLNV